MTNTELLVTTERESLTGLARWSLLLLLIADSILNNQIETREPLKIWNNVQLLSADSFKHHL